MMRILLADLFHDYRPNQICVPLGVGFVGEYLKSLYGDDVSVTLFKSPEQLLSEIRKAPHPDVVGLSNYSWNIGLNQLVIERLRIEFPETVIISGGPHIRINTEGIKEYLKDNPYIDYYIMFEGEFPTGHLIGHMLKEGGRPLKPTEMAGNPIHGVAYLYKDELIYQTRVIDKKELDLIPSPILSGVLDECLENIHYMPLIETVRGCPFACTFCSWGISVLDKVRKFDLERVIAEIHYVAEISHSSVWYFTDANFGMLPRDVEIAHVIREVADNSPYLQTIGVNWAKNSSKYCTEIAHILRGITDPLVAVQTTDKTVLKNIKRANIKSETMSDLVEQGRRDGVAMTTDVLAGLSGETLDSHMNTLREVFAIGFEAFNIGQIRMLPGSEMETPEDRKKWGVKTKYRFINGFSGLYDGEPVCEYEESVVETNTMSRDDMYTLRVVHMLAWVLWNSGLGQPLLRYMFKVEGINPLDAILWFTDLEPGSKAATFLEEYKTEAKQEWFDSSEELVTYFKENHQELLDNQYLKLNTKYLSQLLLNPDLAREMLNVIAAKTQLKVANELVEFCMERILFIGTHTLTKNISFSTELVEALSRVYPTVIPDGQSICQFSITPKLFRSIGLELERFDFDDDPIRALTLTCHEYGTKMIYDFAFGEVVEKTGSEVFFDSFDYAGQLKPRLQSN